MKITLREAEEFHGHLGPYLILGILAGKTALKALRCKKYFELEVKVWGATQKPKSCLIDGLQLSTGATYGKGNIEKLDGSVIEVEIYNRINNKRAVLKLKDDLITRLKKVKTHRDAKILAKVLYKTDPSEIFNLQLTT